METSEIARSMRGYFKEKTIRDFIWLSKRFGDDEERREPEKKEL